VPQSSINKAPSAEVVSILNTLCNDPKNNVFIVSGRGRDSLDEWFSPCEKLGIAAEHGYFVRYAKKVIIVASSWILYPYTSHSSGYMIKFMCFQVEQRS